MDEEFAPLTTPGCIVKARTVSLAFECRAEPTHAGLIMIDDEVFLAFACPEHKSTLIAPRRMLDRDRAELERRRHSWTWARAGHPPLPIESLRSGAAAHRLVEKARAWGPSMPRASSRGSPAGQIPAVTSVLQCDTRTCNTAHMDDDYARPEAFTV